MNLIGAKTFHVLPGHLLLAPDPDIIRSKAGIWFPDSMHKKAEGGLCVQHSPLYLDEDLEGKRLLVEKWAWRAISLDGTPFYIVPEGSVFAVIETIIDHTHPDWCGFCRGLCKGEHYISPSTIGY
jgi:co-chaperonin GroES (HSP10)